jgi:2-polyprenyl-3-methyl-5-hydroxy-6-metoxy-1,4-benzoquinol methylase
MRAIDRLLQRWRMQKALPYVPAGAEVLDIGCYDGAFVNLLRARAKRVVGIDPLATPSEDGTVTILRGSVPGDPRLEAESFDCVTLLGTLEHMADAAAVARECYRVTRPGGRVVLTVPHSLAHRIVHALMELRISDGMGLEVDYGFDVRTTAPILTAAGLRLVKKQSFELGLNHLYVFEKP